MDVKEVALRLKLIGDDYEKGLQRAGDSTLGMSKVAGAALAAVAVSAGAMAVKAADETDKYGLSIMKLARISGDSVETMSKLNFAAQQSGVGTDTLANGIKFLEKNMAAANPEFDKLGVSVTDSNGKMRSSHAVFLDTAEAISHLGSGADRTGAILKIFGRAGLELGPLLAKGRQGIIDLENEAQKYGLVLTKDNVAAIQANVKAHRELDAALQGAKIRLGEEVLPALTTVTEAFAKLPGPVSAAIVPIAGVSAGLLAVATIAPQVVTSVKLVAPAIAGMVTSTVAGMTALGAALSGGALIAIGGLLYDIHEVKQESEDLQKKFSAGIDWSSFDKAASGAAAEAAQVKKLNDEYKTHNMLTVLGAVASGERRKMEDLDAQYEEDQKHLEENTHRAEALGRALGISTDQAKRLAEAAHIDLSNVDPGKYTPVMQQFARGQISAADATHLLALAQQDAADAAGDHDEKIKALKDDVKAQNDAEKALIDPQMQAVDAQNKAVAAQDKVRSSERALEDAHRGVADAQQRVTDAEHRRDDASRKVTDAIAAQRDAQQALNDLLRGPTPDERLNVDSAKLALAEAQRRATGQTAPDPGLEKQRNALDVRRAQIDLQRAEAAHGDAVKQAQKGLADATQNVKDARAAQADAERAVADARRQVDDATRKVTDAEGNLRQANIDTAKAAIDLDTAQRNLNLGFATGEISVDQSIEALKRWVTQGLINQAQADSLRDSWLKAKAAADVASAPPPPPPLISSPVPPIDDQGRAHAAGGPLAEGWNLVGEQGPELVFKAGTSALVRTAPDTRGLLTPHAATAAAAPWQPQPSSGGYHHHGDIHVHPPSNERTAADIAWAQRKMAIATTGPS